MPVSGQASGVNLLPLAGSYQKHKKTQAWTVFGHFEARMGKPLLVDDDGKTRGRSGFGRANRKEIA